MHAYLWDRYYGISLAKYRHIDVVNSVAFNPKDSEMLVTTSDDYTIKVKLKKITIYLYTNFHTIPIIHFTTRFGVLVQKLSSTISIRRILLRLLT